MALHDTRRCAPVTAGMLRQTFVVRNASMHNAIRHDPDRGQMHGCIDRIPASAFRSGGGAHDCVFPPPQAKSLASRGERSSCIVRAVTPSVPEASSLPSCARLELGFQPRRLKSSRLCSGCSAPECLGKQRPQQIRMTWPFAAHCPSRSNAAPEIPAGPASHQAIPRPTNRSRDGRGNP